MSAGVEPWREHLRPIFAGRKWLVVGGPKAGLLSAGRELVELGAERPFLLADGLGTGELPSPEEFAGFTLDVPGGNMVESHRVYERMMGEAPPGALAAVDRWDPGREALAVGKILLEEVPQVDGRRRFGARRPEWIELEDKVVIDGFWDACGIGRPPSRIVAPKREALGSAAAELDRGLGTAWAGDAREGANGGGIYLRWVRDGEQAAQALEFFRCRCDRVRVTPFLEGIPCSISGIVFAGGAAIFRPVEMCILRRPGQSELFYGGFATYWDPATADRETMREVARRTAEGLRGNCNYRGAFTVDGVMSAEAWLYLTTLADGNGDGALSAEEVSDFLAEQLAEERDEGRQLFAELDADGDGGLDRRELPGEVRVLFSEVDADGSGRIELVEFLAIDFDDPRIFLQAEILNLFEELNGSRGDQVLLEDLPPDDRRELTALDPARRYTVKAQHLRDVILRGSNSAGLVGNEHFNRLVGNAGDNWLDGRGLSDHLEGGAGIDTAIYRGPRAEYEILVRGQALQVKDLDIGRDGIDWLVGVERLRFADGEIDAPSGEGR